jgi:DNA-binding response OmpR family regulator
MNTRILLIEDEHSVASLIRKALTEEEYEVSVAMDGHSAWDHISRWQYDLFIIDVMLPGSNGMDICRKVRQQGIPTPILMLTALGSVDNIVMGLDSGADDYLTKPFKIAELLARVRSLLRRAPATSPTAGSTVTTPATVPVQAPASPAARHSANVLVFSDLTLNLDEKNARRAGRTIELTATEFRLLEYLMRNPRKVLSRMDILEKVWGYDFNMNTKSVDVYINYLRKKLETPEASRIIHTVVGMGYILKGE